MFAEFHHQVRGRAHTADGTRGQDRTAYASRGGVQVMCLADGAGSAYRSEYGAQAVVDEGCAILAERFLDFAAGDDAAGARRYIIDALRTRLARTAVRIGCDVVDLASTFLAVAVSDNRFIVAHVGDGVIGYLKDGEVKVASRPDNSEFANETTFVTSSDAVESLRLFRGSLDGVTGFVLMSDGTSESLFDHSSQQLAPACSKLIAMVAEAPTRAAKNPAHKKRLRRLLNTRIRMATRDDCSIGILAQKAG